MTDHRTEPMIVRLSGARYQELRQAERQLDLIQELCDEHKLPRVSAAGQTLNVHGRLAEFLEVQMPRMLGTGSWMGMVTSQHPEPPS